MTTTVLDIRHLYKSFGGLTAVSDFNLQLKQGEIQGIIGPNGAGKTTVFNLITGVYQVDQGQIILGTTELTSQPADRIARLGIARTFQNIRLFGEMTVLDNIKMAFHHRTGYRIWDTLFRTPCFRRQEKQILQDSLTFLDCLNLSDRRDELAKNLPYGEQRRLEIARALAANPQVILLDEPAAGMNPKEVENLIELIRRIHREFSVSILLIEHQMPLVMELCQSIQVMDFGQTIAWGPPAQVTSDPQVIKAYLGEEDIAL